MRIAPGAARLGFDLSVVTASVPPWIRTEDRLTERRAGIRPAREGGLTRYGELPSDRCSPRKDVDRSGTGRLHAGNVLLARLASAKVSRKWVAARSARAPMVLVGLTAAPVGSRLPSMM